MTRDEILHRLESLGNPQSVEGMARFGITAKKVLGVTMPELRSLAKEIGKDHGLAQDLWSLEIRETRILASLIADPKQMTEVQLERWVHDFDSWEICDQCCINLFERTPFAWQKAVEWSAASEEFVKRAGFVMMARLSVGDKKAADERFEQFFPIMKREAGDGRNNVKKAINWALRQIGKRNRALNQKAIQTAHEIREIDSSAARWIASDALRELTSDAIQNRLRG